MLPDETLAQAGRLLERLQARGLTLATAESCTGGLIAAALTAVPGSSATVLAGFVTYSNGAKTAMLGVPEAVIAPVAHQPPGAVDGFHRCHWRGVTRAPV